MVNYPLIAIVKFCDSGPKAHKVIAQGNALGTGIVYETSPNGAEWVGFSFRPFRALVFGVYITWGVAPGFHIAPHWGESQWLSHLAPFGLIALAVIR